MKASDIPEGRIIVDISTAAGGVSYERRPLEEHSINRGRGARAELMTTRVVDNVAAVAALDAVVKAADYACRCHCAKTSFGWFTPADRLPSLRAAFDQLERRARLLNDEADRLRSAHRVTVGFVPALLDVNDWTTIRVLASTIAHTLADVRAALRAGSVRGTGNRLHAATLRARNLDLLAGGEGRVVVRAALDAIPQAKSDAILRLRRGEVPDIAGRALDLSAITAAIARFSDERAP